VAGLLVVVPLLQPAGWWPPVAAAAAMVGVALSLGWAGRRFGIESRIGRVDDRPSGHFGPPADARWLLDRPLLVAEAVCLIGALLVWQVDLLYTAAAGGIVVGYLARRRAGAASGLPVGLLASLVALGGAWWLTVAAPEAVPGRTLAALQGTAFSPEHEALFALLLLGSAWPVLRLWPFHGATTGVLSPLFGLALLVRVAVVVAPLGVAHWLPAAAAVTAIAAWHGAARRWSGEALIAAGVCAVLSLPEDGAWAGPGLIALGTLYSLAGPVWRSTLARILNLVLTAGMVALLPVVLANALAEETVWATVLAAGLAVAWSREWSPRSPRVDLSNASGHIPNSSPGIAPAP
jgi:energy-converting hydrogenase Eha subunit E